jgi:transcriptional regulator with XRE-family HTH domain
MPRRRSEDVALRFGDNLRRVRRREGLSQEQLALRASLHRTAVGLLEAGHRTSRIDTLLRLAGSMAVAPEELIEGIVWVPAPEIEGIFTFNSIPIIRHREEHPAQGQPS